MSIILFALLIGIVAGLRAMIPLAAVSWMAATGHLDLSGTRLAFLGYRWAPYIFSVIAAAELVADQLPSTPSRKIPPQFATRIVTGAFAGAVLGIPSGNWVVGLVAGAIGAVIGTLGGAAARSRLARMFGHDRPAAILEDFVAIAIAVLVALAR
ncbi:DUF4126 family protein [uncultured Methylovirgula sp.]|uniref:DUF4126 family protein n=1 Tax=uncultured Methylovirgula sp. TaxID=1285960 RepID=UPI0026360455|nr:DUF4126 family protein [uncultured Methylovirgula sp.]